MSAKIGGIKTGGGGLKSNPSGHGKKEAGNRLAGMAGGKAISSEHMKKGK